MARLRPPDAPARAERHLELFIPQGLGAGERYKYELRGKFDHTPFLKADPYAREFETPPATAALTSGLAQYRWRDDEWVTAREASNGNLSGPVSTARCTASWARVAEDGNRSLSYRELGERLVPYVKDMGFTHLELLPVLEHPFGGYQGYQVTGFFAPTSRHGSPDDFRQFVDECHRNGIGVISTAPGHPEGRARPRPLRRHRALRARGSAARRTPGSAR